MRNDRRPTSQSDDPKASDPSPLGEQFARHRDRLRLVVGLRLDLRLQERVDPSDLIQDVYLEVVKRYDENHRAQSLSPCLWLRFLTMQRLLWLHRQHLQLQARDAGREVFLDRPGATEVSS